MAVGLLGVGAVGRQPAERGAEARARSNRKDLVFVVLVASARIDHFLPRLRVVEPAGADLARYPVMEELADPRHEVAMFAEQLGQRHGVRQVLAKMRFVFQHSRRVRTQAGKERGAAGIAQRELAIGAVEAHAALRQSIDVRRTGPAGRRSSRAGCSSRRRR